MRPHVELFAAAAAIVALAGPACALPAQGGPTGQQPVTTTAQPANPARGGPIAVIDKGDQAQITEQYVYTFKLDSFRITNTRSLHNDTDYVAVSVSVNGKPAVSLPPISMGDLNNGTYTVNAVIPNIVVGPNDAVAFNYSIVNSGYDKNSLETVLKGAIDIAVVQAALAAALIGTDGAIAVVGPSSTSWFLSLQNVAFPDCDGPVAGATHEWTGSGLAKRALGKTISTTEENKGSDSPHGCGSNSDYFVSWEVTGVKTVAAPNK